MGIIFDNGTFIQQNIYAIYKNSVQCHPTISGGVKIQIQTCLTQVCISKYADKS